MERKQMALITGLVLVFLATQPNSRGQTVEDSPLELAPDKMIINQQHRTVEYRYDWGNGLTLVENKVFDTPGQAEAHLMAARIHQKEAQNLKRKYVWWPSKKEGAGRLTLPENGLSSELQKLTAERDELKKQLDDCKSKWGYVDERKIAPMPPQGHSKE